MQAEAQTASRTSRMRSRSSGSIGTGLPSSRRTSAQSASAARASRGMAAGGRCSSRSRPRNSEPKARTFRAAAAPSKARGCGGTCGSTRSPSSSAPIPIGRCARKTAGQEARVSTSAPVEGPSAEQAATVIAFTPMARPSMDCG